MGEAAGNGAKAAEAAGIAKSGSRVWASRALKDARIVSRIANLQTEITNSLGEKLAIQIADATERRTVLTGIARDTEAWVVARIKAIDTLNRMDGAYIQRHEFTGPVQVVASLSDERL